MGINAYVKLETTDVLAETLRADDNSESFVDLILSHRYADALHVDPWDE